MDEDFFLNLPKKELQFMCKNYGLSPYKTKSDLAKSLVSYLELEKQMFSSISSSERLSDSTEASFPTFPTPQLQPGTPINSMQSAIKDRYGITSHPRDEAEKENCSKAVNCKKMDSCTGTETSHSQLVSDSGNNDFMNEMDPLKVKSDKNNLGCSSGRRVVDMPQNMQHQDTGFPFEFYVRSEEGINLYVDLNSTARDWMIELKNSVHITKEMRNEKSRVLPHQEVGRTGDTQEVGRTGDVDKQIDHLSSLNANNDPHVLSEILMEKGHVGLDQPDTENVSLVDTVGEVHSVGEVGEVHDVGVVDEVYNVGEVELSNSSGNNLPTSAEESEENNATEKLESSNGLEKKRPFNDISQDYGKPEAKILRRSKNSKVSPRRSMRLVPK